MFSKKGIIKWGGGVHNNMRILRKGMGLKVDK